MLVLLFSHQRVYFELSVSGNSLRDGHLTIWNSIAYGMHSILHIHHRLASRKEIFYEQYRADRMGKMRLKETA